MKQFLLAVALIAVPVCAFSAFHLYLGTTTVPSTPGFGDLSSFKTIVTDVEAIASKGDFVAAEHRLTDFETEWDKAQSTLRPLDTAHWGNIDVAHDEALRALRTATPVAAQVSSTFAALLEALNAPARGAVSAELATIGGVTITDENGRALPCEGMLSTFKSELASVKLSDADKAKVGEFQTKGTERCNADDDKRADELFAQGLSLMRQ